MLLMPAMSRPGDCRLRSAPVDLATVGDSCDEHQAVAVSDGIHDAVVADADAVVVATRELGGAPWARIVRKRVDCSADAISQRPV